MSMISAHRAWMSWMSGTPSKDAFVGELLDSLHLATPYD